MMRLAYACLLCLAPAACISDAGRPAGDTGDGAPGDTDPGDTGPAEIGPDAESCSEKGVTRCAGDQLATEVCMNGVWQRAPCGEEKICVVAGGAQCVDSTGDNDCRDTFYCFIGCQLTHGDDRAAGEACFIDCFRGATQPAQYALAEALGCIQNCADTGFACVAERCSQDLADCYFDATGDKSCGTIIECRLACGADDTACAKACGADATFEAQGQYAVLELCTIYACAGRDAQCMARESLPTGACGAYASECVGLLPSTPR